MFRVEGLFGGGGGYNSGFRVQGCERRGVGGTNGEWHAEEVVVREVVEGVIHPTVLKLTCWECGTNPSTVGALVYVEYKVYTLSIVLVHVVCYLSIRHVLSQHTLRFITVCVEYIECTEGERHADEVFVREVVEEDHSPDCYSVDMLGVWYKSINGGGLRIRCIYRVYVVHLSYYTLYIISIYVEHDLSKRCI